MECHEEPPLPIVEDYEITAGLLSHRVDWKSTLKLLCPHCIAHLKTTYQGPRDPDDCPKCGKEFLISPKKLIAAIQMYELEQQDTQARIAEEQRTRREGKELLQRQRAKKRENERKSETVLPPPARFPQTDNHWKMKWRDIIVVSVMIAAVKACNSDNNDAPKTTSVQNNINESDSVVSRINQLDGADWHRMSSTNKDAVCRELSRRLREEYPFVTPQYVRDAFETYFRSGFGSSENLKEVLALHVLLGDEVN